jgi:lipopolysaccharide transport system permease protein
MAPYRVGGMTTRSAAETMPAAMVDGARRGPAGGPEVVIEPARRWPTVDLRELWRYRELFFFFVWRDLKVRYVQTVLGPAWAILQPVFTMLIFTLVFGWMARLPSDGVPYAVFALAAIVPWTYFSQTLAGASISLVNNVNLLTKVYFPRLVIPMAPVLLGLVDFGVAFLILAVMMLVYGIVPPLAALGVVPLLTLIMMLTAAGVSCWLAALNIQYRDVRPLTPFLVQAWMYLSPVVYPMSLVPERFRLFYALNPMVGVIEGFRAVLLGTRELPWLVIGLASVVAGLLFVSGIRYFARVEEVFADVA